MKHHRSGGTAHWVLPILLLPIMDWALIRLIVMTIRSGKPETGLFLIAYLQFVPQEIALRAFFTRKKKRSWRHWAGWICRWSGILILLLAGLYLIQGGSWKSLILPDLYNSKNWLLVASVPLRWIFTLGGMTVILSRRATRKKSLIISGILFPSLFLLVGIVGPLVGEYKAVSNLLGNLFLLAVPHLYGLAGALVDPLFGKKIQLEEEKLRARKKAAPAQIPAAARRESASPAASPQAAKGSIFAGPPPQSTPTAQSVPRPSTPRPASAAPRTATAPPAAPKDPEKELATLKAEYEARMKREEAAKKKQLDETPPEDLLKQTAKRLFSEGQAAATLGGQRQLVYWMAQAVPCLNGLIRQPIGKQFFAPSLTDNPDAFLPLLDELLSEAARLLQNRQTDEEDTWKQLPPDLLCAGWYALTRFAAVSGSGQLFSDEAARLERFFRKHKPCAAWLRAAYEAPEEGMEP